MLVYSAFFMSLICPLIRPHPLVRSRLPVRSHSLSFVTQYIHLHHTDRERLERIEREKQEAAARALALAQAQVREPYTLTKPIANHLPPHQFTRSTHPIIPSYQPTVNQCSPHLLPPYIT